MANGTVTISIDEYQELKKLEEEVEKHVRIIWYDRHNSFNFYSRDEAIIELASINQELRTKLFKVENELQALQVKCDKKRRWL